MPEEPQIFFLSDIDQLFIESLADDSTFPTQLHHLDNRINTRNSHPSPAQSTSTQSTLDTPISSTTCTTSSPSASEAAQEVPEGKVKIDRVPRTKKCSTCKKEFLGDVSYRQHVQRGKCFAQRFPCTALGCGKTFPSERSLERHQNSSCRSSMQPKRFACTCDKRYARKDELIRHTKKKNDGRTFPEHRCKACDHGHCICPSGRTR